MRLPCVIFYGNTYWLKGDLLVEVFITQNLCQKMPMVTETSARHFFHMHAWFCLDHLAQLVPV